MTGLERTPHRRLDARPRNVAGTMYLAGPEEAFQLSEVAALIWRLVDGKRTISEIGAAIAAEYDVGADDAARDAAELLEQFERAGVVELRPCL